MIRKLIAGSFAAAGLLVLVAATPDAVLANTVHATPGGGAHPGTLELDTILKGKLIKRVRVRFKDKNRCFDECQSIANCDGVTVQSSAPNVPVSCMLWTEVTPEHVHGWVSWIPVQRCESDHQCDDGKFCTGVERCRETSGSLRCQPGTNPCAAGETCDEGARRCKQPCHDKDGDGYESAVCGGRDCNDADVGMFPGNGERCDSVDNDCNPCTVGDTDADHDGYISAGCTNPTPVKGAQPVCDAQQTSVDPKQHVVRGRDCDDHNPAIRPGSMKCDADPHYTRLCVDGAWERRACAAGTTCQPQPDGTGLCMH